MSYKTFSVFEDLFELSQAADNLIEKTLAESAFDRSFFEDTKKEIYRVLINKSPPKKKKSERRSSFRTKKECVFEPFLEIRAHVHEKPFSGSLEKNRTPMISNEESISCKELSNISLFDKHEMKIQKNKGINSDDSWNKSSHQLKVDSVRNSESTFEKYSTPYDSNVCKSTYSKMSEKVDSGNFHDLSPISNEFRINPIQNEETTIISSEGDNRTPQDVSIETADINSDDKKLSSERVDRERETTSRINKMNKLVNGTDANISDLNKTYIRGSDSNRECIYNNALSSSSELCCDCTALSFSAKKQCKKKEFNSFLLDYGVLSKNHSSVSSSGYVSGNPFEENTAEKSPVNLRTMKREKPLVNKKESSIVDEKELLMQYQNKTSERGNTYSENDRLPIIAFKEPLLCSKKAIYIPPRKLLLTSIRENEPTFVSQSPYSGEKNSSTTSQSFESLSSDSEKSRIQERKDTGKVSTEYEKGKFKKKLIANKEHPIHFRTFSAPVNRKITTGLNLRPKTPTDFVNSNHQSLKVKAEEKRQQREIRVQRTKERRERLEREREERMRDREQKLKKRFQQHEEMLKQKTETFKIKSRIREQRYNKRSGASTSSKDSKEDRTKDNDDFCRNAVNSGQKLYKESNGNRDVTPGEYGLVSLDGDVGSNPEVSPKENAIPKCCEETPVEFPVYSSNAKTADMISLKEGRKLQLRRYSNSEQITDYTPIVLKPSKNLNKENVLSKPEENESPKMVEKKENFEHSKDVKCITTYAKRSKNIDKASKELFKSCNSKHSQNTYLLRSAVKRKEKKINDITDFSLNKDDNSNCKNSGDKQVNAKEHKNIRNSSENEKMCTNLCFKVRKIKPKKVIKAPRKHQIHESNGCKSFTNPTRFKTYRLYDSSNESVKAEKVPNKTHKVLSYKIPEEVDDSSEDTTDDSSKIPLWATGIYLKQALIQQFYHPPNAEDIFGVLRKKPVNLAALFGKDKPSYHHRTSSENWSLDDTPK